MQRKKRFACVLAGTIDLVIILSMKKLQLIKNGTKNSSTQYKVFVFFPLCSVLLCLHFVKFTLLNDHCLVHYSTINIHFVPFFGCWKSYFSQNLKNMRKLRYTVICPNTKYMLFTHLAGIIIVCNKFSPFVSCVSRYFQRVTHPKYEPMTTNTVGCSASNNVDLEPSVVDRFNASLIAFSEYTSVDILRPASSVIGLLLCTFPRC